MRRWSCAPENADAPILGERCARIRESFQTMQRYQYMANPKQPHGFSDHLLTCFTPILGDPDETAFRELRFVEHKTMMVQNTCLPLVNVTIFPSFCFSQNVDLYVKCKTLKNNVFTKKNMFFLRFLCIFWIQRASV